MLYTELRAFHAVVRQGSFTRAAEVLRVSQPTVSEQVKRLETRFRIRLFERGARRVEPTDLGRRLAETTNRLFTAETDAEQILASARGLQYGRLRVGADSPYLVMPHLGAFRRRHPGIQVSLALGNRETVLAGLFSRRTDVAVLPEIAGDDRLHVRRLSTDRLVALVPVGHAWSNRTAVDLDDLVRTVLVLRESGSQTRSLVEQAIETAGLRLGECLEIGSREAVREAVAAGLGVGIVAASERGHDPRLTAIGIRGEALSVTEYLACIAERRQVRAVAAFLEVIGEEPT